MQNDFEKKLKKDIDDQVEKLLEKSLEQQRRNKAAAHPVPKDPNVPDPEKFIEYYDDGSKLYKINSYIKAVAKYVTDQEEKGLLDKFPKDKK